jgi:hypothetical protein
MHLQCLQNVWTYLRSHFADCFWKVGLPRSDKRNLRRRKPLSPARSYITFFNEVSWTLSIKRSTAIFFRDLMYKYVVVTHYPAFAKWLLSCDRRYLLDPYVLETLRDCVNSRNPRHGRIQAHNLPTLSYFQTENYHPCRHKSTKDRLPPVVHH